MSKIVRLTENDLIRLVKRVIKEQKLNFGSDSKENLRALISLCDKSIAKPDYESDRMAKVIYDAIDGLGTTEVNIQLVFRHARAGGMTPFCRVVKSYKTKYGKNLFDALDDDIDVKSDWDYIFQPLKSLSDMVDVEDWLESEKREKGYKATGY